MIALTSPAIPGLLDSREPAKFRTPLVGGPGWPRTPSRSHWITRWAANRCVYCISTPAKMSASRSSMADLHEFMMSMALYTGWLGPVLS